MNYLPAQMYLDLQRLDTQRLLIVNERKRLALARVRAEKDRLALQRAWEELSRALEAESRSRREFHELIHSIPS